MAPVTDDELKSLFNVMRQENAVAHAETRRQVENLSLRVDDTTAETRQQVENLRLHVDETTTETRRQFNVAVEHFDHRFDLLAEAITTVDEKAERRAAALEERMEHGFAETRAMINLQARVERLESSTH